MSKNRKKHKISDTKKNKPFLKFNFLILILIFALSFTGCFALYMVSANLDKDFFENKKDSETSSSFITESEDDSLDLSLNEAAAKNVSNPVPECSPADESYFEKSMFIADSFILGSENTRLKNVIGSTALNASNLNTAKLDSANGSNTAEELVKAALPENIYILLSNNISDISGATGSIDTFITNLMLILPDSDIYIMEAPPVSSQNTEVTNEQINSYNSALLNLANKKSVYCIDTNTLLKNNDGSLNEKYYSADTSSLNQDGVNKICDYVLTHIAQN